MYVYWTPDDTFDLIEHLALVLTYSTHMIYRLCGHLTSDSFTDCLIYCLLKFTYYCSFIPVYGFISYAHTLYACALFFYFTHSLSRFLTTLDLHIQIVNVFILWTRYSMRLDMLRGSGVSFYSILVFRRFPDFSYIRLIAYSILLFIWYHVWTSICSIAVILIYCSRLLYLVQVALGLACIHGVFFSCIYVTDSRRNFIFTYFGKWGMTCLD